MILALLLACGGGASPTAAEAPAEPAAAPLESKAAAVPWPVPQAARHREASPLLRALTPAEQAARARLEAVVRANGVDLGEPWALGHALIALGADTTLPSGEPALDALFATWARPAPGGGVRFATREGQKRVEPHADLVLKEVVDLGLGPDHAITVKGTPSTLAALYRGALGRTWADEHGAARPANDLVWTLQGVAAWSPPHATWTTEDGQRGDVDALTHALVVELQRGQGPLVDAQQTGLPLVKRGQGIFRFTCGGAHLVQAVAAAVAAGHGRDGDRAAVEVHAGLHRFRLAAELALIDDALRTAPEHATVLTVQRLKFLGHWIETTHRLVAQGFLPPEEGVAAELVTAGAELAVTVRSLEEQGVLDGMDALRGAVLQTWLDLIGDSAHAVRAWDITAGAPIVW